jgi:hypothetical protein
MPMQPMAGNVLSQRAAPAPAPSAKKAGSNLKRTYQRRPKLSPAPAAGLAGTSSDAAAGIPGPAGIKKPGKGGRRASGKAKGAKDANITPMLAAAAMGPPVQSFTAMLASAGVQMQAPDADAVPQLWQQVQVASAATAAAGSISIQEAQPLPILPLDISSGGIGLDLSQLMKEPLPSQLLDASPRELFNEQSLQELLQHLQTPQKGKKGAGSRPSSAGMQLAAALKQLKSPDKQLDEAMMAALMRDGEGSMKVSPLVRLRR